MEGSKTDKTSAIGDRPKPANGKVREFVRLGLKRYYNRNRARLRNRTRGAVPGHCVPGTLGAAYAAGRDATNGNPPEKRKPTPPLDSANMPALRTAGNNSFC